LNYYNSIKGMKRKIKEMINYDKSFIYKLCCKDPSISDIYIGSTVNPSRRKCQHKYICNNSQSKMYNLKVYEFIRNTGGFKNWSMVELERYSAKDKSDLHKRERYWIENERSTLNCDIPTRTKYEWTKDNKEKIIVKQGEYRKANKENIAKYNYEYYKANKDKICEYYKDNKDKIRVKQAGYYKDNKDKIALINSEKVKCDCGSIVTHSGIYQHRKTKKHQKHQKLIEQNNNNNIII